MNPDTPISSLPGIGSYYTFKLKKVGVETVKDLLYHIPTRYQDFSDISPISLLQPGEKVTIQGQITSIKNIFTRSRKQIQTAVLSDGQDEIEIIWFNQPFIVRTLPEGTHVSLSGTVGQYGRKKTLVSPQYEKVANGQKSNNQTPNANPQTIHTGRLVPVYPETDGLSSKWLRSRISHILPQAIDNLNDPLPHTILQKYTLIPLKAALNKAHFPKNLEDANLAKRRLAFDELFELQLKSLVRKKEWKQKKTAQPFLVDSEKILNFTQTLPFSLTDSQKRASREILKDLGQSEPMNRLLEGDVGSGKTVVAALACFVTSLNGYQSAIMAPTQILANQHFNTLRTLLKPHNIKVALITSETRSASQGETLRSYDVVAGTHALVHPKSNTLFKQLGLVVIDEQHRFGVRQRALLSEHKTEGKSPHILTMTATPIPRTIALTAYGDLDLSTLDELPAGRQKIKTWVVPPRKRDSAYQWIHDRVKGTDEQAFIVCPLIEESQKETMKSVKAASAEFEKLQKEVFPDLRLGLLHGRIKSKEKQDIMDKMKKGVIDILVATPVVEVGIDFPNATIMMIEGSERFGLAQLHQLRGRVGRGTKQSYCLLFSDSRNPQVLRRLKSLERSLSGKELAQIDLDIRGPGEIYGTAQHGYPELKIASFADHELIKTARSAAEGVVGELHKYPQLEKIVQKEDFVVPN
ncbi:MAG: ATP-dependent DNA helicase RecG [Patescibacteria group bacterium]